MKRLLIYIMVAIVLVVCGVSIYYVVRDDETITSLVADTDSFYMNVNETLDIPIKRDNPAEYADFAPVDDGWDKYVKIDLNAWKMTAIAPGPIRITFKSTNEKYKAKEFIVDCKIGDGSTETPYYLRNEDDLNRIGKFGWHYSDHYELANDIVMTKPFMPIGIYGEDGEIRYDNQSSGKIVIDEFTGTFSGGIARHKIINMNIEQGNLNYSTAGFFSKIGKGGVVENVVFENSKVEGRFFYAGTVAGVCYGTIGKCSLNNCTVINNLDMSSDFEAYTGGVCGLLNRIDSRVAEINICSIDVNLASKSFVGGVAGRNDGGVIFNCLVKTSKLDFNPSKEFFCYGGIAAISKYEAIGDYENNIYEAIYDPFVSNCVVYIEGLNTMSGKTYEIFGEYGAMNGAYTRESRGTYDNLYYVYGSTSSKLKKYGDCYNDEAIIVKEITDSEATNPETYEGCNFDFENVWHIVEGERLQLGLDYADGVVEYQAYSTRTTSSNITKENVAQVFQMMRSNPSADRTYVITEDIVYDGKVYGTEWQPIGTEDSPFIGKIKSMDGKTLTFKNLNINSNMENRYGGIFGIVYGTNTEIEGIDISETSEFFEIKGSVVGAIAGYNSMAHISNCNLSSFNIKAKQIAGGVVGINDGGKIENCKVNAEEYLTEQPVYDEMGNDTGETDFLPTINGRGKTIFGASLTSTQISLADGATPDATLGGFALGGIAGINNGSLSDCVSGGVQIKLGADDLSNVYAGGIMGYSKGFAQDVTVDRFGIIATEFKGRSYAGGLVGWQDGGKIEYALVASISGNTIQFAVDNDKTTAGGFVGIMSQASAINYSVSDSMTINAAMAGGFAGVASGKISQSYISSTTTLNCAYVGGFAVSLFDGAVIENCMTAANLNGSTLSAGMTLYLFRGSLINFCYIDPKFKPNQNDFGKESNIYAETASQYRRSPMDYGTITNTAIVGSYKPLLSGIGNKALLSDDDIVINGVKAKLQTKFFILGVNVFPIEANEVSTSKAALEEAGFDFNHTWNKDTEGYFLPTEASKVVVSAFMNSAATHPAYIYANNIDSIKITVNGNAVDRNNITSINGGFKVDVALGGTIKLQLTAKEGYEITDVIAVSGTVAFEDGAYTYSDYISDSAILTFVVEEVYNLEITAPNTSAVKVEYGSISKNAAKGEGDVFIVQVPKGNNITITLTVNQGFAVTGESVSSGVIAEKNNNGTIQYILSDYLKAEGDEEKPFTLTFTVTAQAAA